MFRANEESILVVFFTIAMRDVWGVRKKKNSCLENRKILLLQATLLMLCHYLTFRFFSAETRSDWWRIRVWENVRLVSQRSAFIERSFFRQHSAYWCDVLTDAGFVFIKFQNCALYGEIKWFEHTVSGKSINFLQRDIFTTAWDSEMQFAVFFSFCRGE